MIVPMLVTEEIVEFWGDLADGMMDFICSKQKSVWASIARWGLISYVIFSFLCLVVAMPIDLEFDIPGFHEMCMTVLPTISMCFITLWLIGWLVATIWWLKRYKLRNTTRLNKDGTYTQYNDDGSKTHLMTGSMSTKDAWCE